MSLLGDETKLEKLNKLREGGYWAVLQRCCFLVYVLRANLCT